MENPGIQIPLRRLQIGGIVAGLLSLGAVVVLTTGKPDIAAVLPAPTFPLSVDEPMPRFRGRCEQCAVVTSIREIGPPGQGIHSGTASGTTKRAGSAMAVEITRRYEVTVQMRDGSTRVFEQARTENWRMHERLILIGGSSAGREPRAKLDIAGDAG